MQIAETEFGKGFIKMCMDGHRMGWHERNGGNFSYRIRPEEIEQIRENLNDTDMWREIGTEVPDLAGEYFLVTGSGKFLEIQRRIRREILRLLRSMNRAAGTGSAGDCGMEEYRPVNCRHIL